MKKRRAFPLALQVERKTPETALAAWRLRSTSGLLLGALKYSWYKYCKALFLIKVPGLFNEVTEGSIDQAFCFMPWRFLFFPHASLSVTEMTSSTLILRRSHNLFFFFSRCSCFARLLIEELLSCSSNLFTPLWQSLSSLPGLVLISLSEEESGVLEDHLTCELSDSVRAGHACSSACLQAHFAAVTPRWAGV